ncbi:nmrA-like family domain-containing protein 1 isoform X2 [Liolophura sinensis]|uniref:nmrA-like family domain-containing protein 1 isoform X2 n=1 Tax=Liolophura sinensis TaxID=3198878 RepID=UPI003158CD7E
MSMLITVFGADGRQGQSVVHRLVNDGKFSVRAVLSNNNRNALAIGRVEITRCDLGDKDAVQQAVCGSYGCFVLTRTEVSRPDATEKEIREGKNIADACALHKVSHVVVSTQLNTERALGIVARNMVAKAMVEEYMREICLPVTGLIIPCYYEHFLDVFKPYKTGPSDYEIAVPMGTHVWDIISVDDVGEVVRHVFNNKTQYLNKTLSLAGDKLTIKEIADILTRQLAPRKFKDKQSGPKIQRQLYQGN